MTTNRTLEFKQALKEKETVFQDTRKRKAPTLQAQNNLNVVAGKDYIKEAYAILNHINTLVQLLVSIRRPYLNVDSRHTPLIRQGPRNILPSGSDLSWADIRYLTNEERDQIDIQTRVVLKRCADRVREMEALEKRRAELVASQVNPLVRLLPARLRQSSTSATSDFVAAHHASITWYLNRRLTEASQNQKEMQEERVKRQLERTRTLGSGATREALSMGIADSTIASEQQHGKDGGRSWLGNASSSLLAAALGTPSPTGSVRIETKFADIPLSDDDEEVELSASQIQQFENENANILRSVQDTLESVQQAESRLMDISALQMELVTHLTRQTEMTDQLYEDAIATTAAVEKGNEQLREAKRRAKDSRLFILIFLIGASLSLLFLHYY